jgi:N-acetylneuraminic acid mutarotase
MPASNHDLTAAVLHDKVYVSGGLTAEWGFPTRSHAFDELWELDPKSWRWRVAARFGRARIYCATAVLEQLIVTGGAGSYGKDYLYNDRTFIWRGAAH